MTFFSRAAGAPITMCTAALRARRALCSIAAATLLAMAMPTGASGQEPAPSASRQNTMVVNADATFVRSAPNVRGAVVTRLERGDTVEVLDRSAGDWWRVRAGDPPREGYVHRLVLAPRPAAPARRGAPEIEPVAPQPRPGPDREAQPGREDGALDAPAPRRGPGLLAFGGVGVFVPTARDTFDAVGITGNPVTYTGGVEVIRVFRSLFVRGSFDWTAETGERVFLTDSGERFGLGIPLDVELLPIEATVGWRFEGRPGARRWVTPYVGGGAGALRYRETDPFADEDEEVDERFAAYHLLAGADIHLHRWIGARAEYRYRFVPDALGNGGVAAITGDTDLGGSLFFVGVVVGR